MSLHLEQHAGKSGPEGRVPAVAWEARGGERMGEVGEVVQRCQYRGIQCAGCQQFFELGEPMLSHGTSLVHQARACQEAHDAQVALEVAQGQEHGRSAAETEFFYGVFTTGREASGVYESWSEVSALIGREGGGARRGVGLVHVCAEGERGELCRGGDEEGR